MLPHINGEFGVVADPELRFSDKGSAWIKVRGIAKDRVRDKTGNWSDGDPLFIDIILNGQAAEHLFESIVKGDTITVSGKLKQREYEKDGEKRTVMEIRADIIGVSVRWGVAKTINATRTPTSVAEIADAFGGEIIEQTEAPF
jgi:single-strand DNA-binding protein